LPHRPSAIVSRIQQRNSGPSALNGNNHALMEPPRALSTTMTTSRTLDDRNRQSISRTHNARRLWAYATKHAQIPPMIMLPTSVKRACLQSQDRCTQSARRAAQALASALHAPRTRSARASQRHRSLQPTFCGLQSRILLSDSAPSHAIEVGVPVCAGRGCTQ